MKKLLLATAAVGLVAAAAPAHAEVKLDLGGYFKGYGFYTNQDDDSVAADSREFDIIRDTEVHFGGETTLDNGLSVGAHVEADADNGGGFAVDETYVYFSGGWGRVNFGSEDGAAYLLQVEAPSADDNLDGLRQYVNPINYNNATIAGGTTFDVQSAAGGLDYDQDVSAKADKLTYLSPIFSGFQVGASYTPDLADASGGDAENENDVVDALGAVYDIGARYEGQFSNVGVILGAGYTQAELEDSNAVSGAGELTDDRQAWNVGADFDIGPFGVGVAYMEDNFGDVDSTAGAVQNIRGEQTTWVVGADYTTGPFKLGASYYDSEGNGNIVGDTGNDGVESTRWTGGVVYTYGPGMTFRGSVSHAEFDNVAGLTTGESFDATSVLVGTQINF